MIFTDRPSRRFAVVLLLGCLAVASAATPARAEVVAWTARTEFEDGSLVNLDATSSPGDLRLSLDPDGWMKIQPSPVLDVGSAGSWDGTSLGSVNVLLDDGLLKMWYSGCAGVICNIGYATSTDGLSWTKYPGNPVLVSGYSWDTTIQNPTVIKDGTTYRMWFSANDFSYIRIGYATSLDGVAWTEYPSPVLSPTSGGWDQAVVSTPVVIREGPSLTMWYSGHVGDYSYRMGRATSQDGTNWTKDPANPIMSAAYSWEESRVHPMQVLGGLGDYELYYYAAFNYVQIGHAVSSDGVSWTRSPTSPILSPGPSSWDRASLGVHSVVTIGAERWMWYSGSDGSTRRIGVAKSPSYFRVGTFTSSVFDSGDNWTRWSLLEWSVSLPPGTDLVLQARSGNTSVPDLQWSGWTTLAGTGIANLSLPRARHFQLNVVLSGDGQDTLVLHEIRLTYYRTARPGPDLMPWIVVGIVGGSVAALGITMFLVTRRRRSGPGALNRATAEALQSSAIRACPHCGTAVPPDHRFCGRCGQRFPDGP